MHDNGRLVIVDLENDEFGAFPKFEFLESFGTCGINGNARTRLVLATFGGGDTIFVEDDPMGPFEIKAIGYQSREFRHRHSQGPSQRNLELRPGRTLALRAGRN